jgi:hypothetical protein
VKQDVHTGPVILLGDGTGHFHEHPYSTGPIIGPVNGFVLALVVLVREGSGVPMCKEQDALLYLGLEPGDDVAQGHLLPGVHGDRTGLFDHLGTQGFEARDQCIATCGMSCSAGDTRTKGHLGGHPGIGAVGVELGCGWKGGKHRCRYRSRWRGLVATSDQQQGGRAHDERPWSGNDR